MTKKAKLKIPETPSKKTNFSYHKFNKLNGEHPLRKAAKESFIEYHVRKRSGGKVRIFNFALAKEIGLIAHDHLEIVTAELEKVILDTFSIIIINEYDYANKKTFPAEDIRSEKYMATRYLQLQHPNKKGKTSGDGRSIWNGRLVHKGKNYDISSSGTGATRLSPATHLEKRFFQSGDPTISYGCGYSEIDEGLSTMFFSEIFHKNRIGTERILGVIEFRNGISINIRVHSSLLRPSHFFGHLKQGNYNSLKDIVDYYINSQEETQEWLKVPKKNAFRYQYFLDKVVESFSRMAAKFEDEYIFCWLDWDGDNILMDGSIIDYGSIRQFGLFHSEYRYDDVQRLSTSIVEQKRMSRYVVQSFAQIVDFLISGKKKNIKRFRNAKATRAFDQQFEKCKLENLVYRIGFSPEQQRILLTHHKRKVTRFKKVFSYFERSKSGKGIYKVSDGFTCDAIFCMRDILRELPQLYLSRGEKISNAEFIEIVRSTYAQKKDLQISAYRTGKIKQFQNMYWDMIKFVAKNVKIGVPQLLLEVSMRSSIINRYDRVTGDSITLIVEKITKRRPKVEIDELYKLLQDFSEYQNLDPNKEECQHDTYGKQTKLMKGILKIVRDFREGL